LLASGWLVCDAAALAAAAAEAPLGVARQTESSPVVDGAVIDDPAWENVEALSSFWQATPDEGSPASERTEVRIVYDKETLYFGVLCYDREPSKIIVSDSRRDAPLDDTDSFQIILDTYLDRQNGFVFGTNPAGIEYDAQVSNEGQGGDRSQNRQQGGAGSGFNINWDGRWTVRARLTDFGWSAEFAIPFRTLRYAHGGAQTWGLNLQRNIRRRNEVSYWAPLTRQFKIYRLSSAGTLRGVSVPSQRNLKLTPYLLGVSKRDYARDQESRYDGDVGGDLKYSLTPSLTLDLTLNTDFAQVEVDEQQINLDRFNLFFPEKRPFFLENAGQFTTGSGGDVELFFSRRIGIGAGGRVIPIVGGGRVSGKVAGMTVGLLDMQTRSLSGVAPENNFGVARLSRDLKNRSGLGMLFVNRQATSGPNQASNWNRTYGVDGRLGLGRYAQLVGFAAKTSSPGQAKNEHAYQLGWIHNSPGWELNAKYTEVGAGFNPEAGFLRRTAFRKPEALIFRRYRPRDFLGLLEIRPHTNYRGYWAPDGFHETGFWHWDAHWEWRNSWEVHTGVNFTHEGVRQRFEIYPGVFVPAGRYDHQETQIVFRTNQGAPLALDSTVVIGGFFGGHRYSIRPTLKARLGETFTTDVRWERNDVELPSGGFVSDLVRTRVSYSFTPRVFVQALLQYNSSIDSWSTNLRFGWLNAAGSGLFVVYNETRDVAGANLGLKDRSLALKFSRLIDVLD
jgi:hypothetical protein